MARSVVRRGMAQAPRVAGAVTSLVALTSLLCGLLTVSSCATGGTPFRAITDDSRCPADAAGGRLRHSRGALARMARACTRLPGISPNARLTMRWRWSLDMPAKAVLSIATVKCDSPLPSSPEWP